MVVVNDIMRLFIDRLLVVVLCLLEGLFTLLFFTADCGST